jgi:hypothetical protein
MIRAPGLLADLDVPFMPRFSLYCYGGDGGGPGGDPGAMGPGGVGAGTGPGSISDAISEGMAQVGIGNPAVSEPDAEDLAEVKAARAVHMASRAAHAAGTISSNPNIEEAPTVTPPTAPSIGTGIDEDLADPQITDPTGHIYGDPQPGHGAAFDAATLLMPSPAAFVLWAGDALTNVPPGYFAPAPGAGSSDPDPTGEGGAMGGPSDAELRDEYPVETAVTPLPEVVDAPSDAAPEMARTPAATSTTTSASADAPTVTPSPATSAPGTLIRRRRRSRTILTSPQGVGVLGGEGSALRGTRRTRSLPRQTLLGG